MAGSRLAVCAALAGAAALPMAAQADPHCADGVCRVHLSPDQLLAAAEKLVREKQWNAAEPLVRALAQAPGYRVQSRFLAGYIAAGQQRWAAAADAYKAILADDPGQTGVRLELAKTFMAMGDYGAADRQFAVVERTRDLSPEIARSVRLVRTTIRARRPWQLDVAAGIAPDTNINNATAADTVTVMFGTTPIPLQLDRDARARSGLGITARIGGSLRLPVAPRVSAIADLDASGTEYRGGAFDTYVAQAAAGAEYKLSEGVAASLQAVGAQRWFGGAAVSRQYGVRGGVQAVLDSRRRVGLQLDVRRSDALFNDAFSGWQYAAYATVERALSPTLVLSVGPYVRRDALAAKGFANVELGSTVGLGGELPHGFNLGVSAGAARSWYDAVLPVFAAAPRRDWQLFGRATLGNRKIRVLGLSPQLAWSMTRLDSSIGYFSTTRSRFELTLARYF